MNGKNALVGDRRRVAIGKAAFSTLWAAITFVVFTVPGQAGQTALRGCTLLNDPYDTLYSFAMFLVPLVTAFFLVQVSLCRKARCFRAERARSVLRGSRVAVIVMTATLSSCWISVAAGANRAQWNASTTTALVVGLAVVNGLDTRAVVMLARAPRLGRSGVPRCEASDDGPAYAVLVAAGKAAGSGPLRFLSPDVGHLLLRPDRDRALASTPRVLGAALASLVFGTAVGLNQGIREGYFLASTLLTAGLLTSGMFAFLMLAC